MLSTECASELSFEKKTDEKLPCEEGLRKTSPKRLRVLMNGKYSILLRKVFKSHDRD